MKISCIKGKNDEKSFRILQTIGADIYEVEDYDKTDETLKQLVKANYNTIWITNELASFSEDIIKKYARSSNVNIFIAPLR